MFKTFLFVAKQYIWALELGGGVINKYDRSKEIKSDFPLVAEGSKLTKELSAFLKDRGRYPSRYDN